MRKNLIQLTFIVTCLMTCLFSPLTANAETEEDVKAMKEKWYDTRYYPLYRVEGERWKYDYDDVLDIVNPPFPLLFDMPSEELAALMQDYPMLTQMLTYFGSDGTQDYESMFSFCEENSDIFYELLRREDGITCFLKSYQTHELDIEAIKNHACNTIALDNMWLAEVFQCQFIRYYAPLFTQEEYELALQVIEEKKEIYKEFDSTTLYYLDLPEIEAPAGAQTGGVRAKYLNAEEIQEKEKRFAAALLEMQAKEENMQTEAPTNKSQRNVIIVVSVIFGVMCVIGGFIFIRRQKK